MIIRITVAIVSFQLLTLLVVNWNDLKPDLGRGIAFYYSIVYFIVATIILFIVEADKPSSLTAYITIMLLLAGYWLMFKGLSSRFFVVLFVSGTIGLVSPILLHLIRKSA